MAQRSTIPFIDIYAVFSAAIAEQYYGEIPISGFGFAASHDGLPDIGLMIPRNATKQAISDSVAALLGRECVGIKEDFFANRANSARYCNSP